MALKKRKIIDGHVHYAHFSYQDSLMAIMDEAGIEKLAVVCTPDEARLSLVPDALLLKAAFPERVYVLASWISHPFLFHRVMPEKLLHIMWMCCGNGCGWGQNDRGEGSNAENAAIPDFDAPVYAPYWEKMAETKMPLIFHVNDPEEFWDAEKVPAWAREMGWFYGDGTYINNEVQYRQVLNVLERHPDLNVTFAHFFFLSAQLDRLAGYFDRFPNMHVDLTPGIEMYFNFASVRIRPGRSSLNIRTGFFMGRTLAPGRSCGTGKPASNRRKAWPASKLSAISWKRKDHSGCLTRAFYLVEKRLFSRVSICREMFWRRFISRTLNGSPEKSPAR